MVIYLSTGVYFDATIGKNFCRVIKWWIIIFIYRLIFNKINVFSPNYIGYQQT